MPRPGTAFTPEAMMPGEYDAGSKSPRAPARASSAIRELARGVAARGVPVRRGLRAEVNARTGGGGVGEPPGGCASPAPSTALALALRAAIGLRRETNDSSYASPRCARPAA